MYAAVMRLAKVNACSQIRHTYPVKVSFHNIRVKRAKIIA